MLWEEQVLSITQMGTIYSKEESASHTMRGTVYNRNNNNRSQEAGRRGERAGRKCHYDTPRAISLFLGVQLLPCRLRCGPPSSTVRPISKR